MYISPIHIPPTLDDASVHFWQKVSVDAVSTVVDRINHRVAWISTALPKFLLFVERWQSLTEVEGGKTKYETLETFNGILAYPLKWFAEGNMKLGVRVMAEGLKERAEK